ncbi:hypothetical protein M0802_004941 [Mischocyttarus mexicanus]|nr:hypothetical protein M0802_004941 [Mischocyttarus mexicanus]
MGRLIPTVLYQHSFTDSKPTKLESATGGDGDGSSRSKSASGSGTSGDGSGCDSDGDGNGGGREISRERRE